MEGSATFTIVASSTIISTPTHSTYSAIQRVRSEVSVEVMQWLLRVVVNGADADCIPLDTDFEPQG